MKRAEHRTAPLLAILAGVVSIALFWSVGAHRLDGYRLAVGSLQLPRARTMYFIAMWTFFGGAAVLFTSFGVARLVADRRDGADAPLLEPDWLRRRMVVFVGTLLAFAIPLAIRTFVIQGAPLTDDESAYRFMARLIASGRLTVESAPPPLKLFFDRFQMVNDGSRYAQYFVGWPALMAPGIWFGVESWMNALYAALAVPPLFDLTRRLADRRAALYAVVLYVASPLLMVSAATLGAHTSCVTALIWTAWAYSRTRDETGGPVDDALFAVAFGVAFFIRPLATVGIGGPLLAAWVWRRLRVDGPPDLRRLAAFAAPSLVLAALFFGVNWVQTGSPRTVAYVEFYEYVRENGARFTGPAAAAAESGVPNLSLSGLARGASVVAAGLLRFDVALFGWPISMIFLLAAGFDARTRLLWLSGVGYLATRFFLHDAGVDLYGPVHFTELAVPAIVLSALGIRRTTEFLTGMADPPADDRDGVRRLWPSVSFVVAILFAAGCYLPVRFGTLGRVAANTGLAERAVARAELDDAVVFAPRPFIPSCLGEQSRHFVLWRVLNPPDLRADVLWVNHVSVEDDRKFMRYAPGRSGYVLDWSEDCRARFVPLDSPHARGLPDAHIGGTGRGPDWSNAPDPTSYSVPRPPG